jgi:pyrroloquinoline-quinone synthase
MNTQEFSQEIDARIAKYDLLCHPFYQAWSAGQSTRDDLREYARDYYHHVEAFPTYLAELAVRLTEGDLRRAVLANMCEESGRAHDGQPAERAHSELWLDFAEGMGANRSLQSRPPQEVKELMTFFHRAASEGTPEEALAAFYAYESQVPRVAATKAKGLRELYGAGDKTCGYFDLHTTADVYHSQVWRKQLEKCVAADEGAAERALDAAERAAQALWRTLDGFEARRMKKAAA